MLKELLKEKYETIKNENNLENKAYMIVSILFEGKLDKGKKPYMEHLLKLRDSVDEENQKIIALLHDTIEDLKITKEELEEIGFPREITDVVQILSRNEKPKERSKQKQKTATQIKIIFFFSITHLYKLLGLKSISIVTLWLVL